MPDANACPAGRRRGAPAPDIHRHSFALPECRDHDVSLEGPPGTEGPDHQPGAHLPEGASNGVGAPARLTQTDGAQKRKTPPLYATRGEAPAPFSLFVS